jgi:uncharacterized protein
MIIELKQVFDIVGESFSFDYPLDLSDYELFGYHPFTSPVNVKGEVSNKAGVVFLQYSADFTLKLHCDRCLDVFNRDFHFAFEQILVTELNSDNDEYIVVEDNRLDLDELCISDILLNLPSKLLCSSDCKGLCPKCGVNLNHQSCLCKKNEVDPRLAVLSQLLVDEED